MRLFGSRKRSSGAGLSVESSPSPSLASRLSLTGKRHLQQQQSKQRSSRGANPASSFSSTSSSFSSSERFSVPLEPSELDPESLMNASGTHHHNHQDQEEQSEGEGEEEQDQDDDFPARKPNLMAKTASHRATNLADFRQLRCSMSYKNRVPVMAYRDDRSTTLLSPSRCGENGTHVDDSTTHTNYVEAVATAAATLPAGGICPNPTPATVDGPLDRSRNTVSNAVRTSLGRTSVSEPKYTEANVAALQTRRAFQQMVLELEDEDSDCDGDSDSELFRTSARSSGDSGVVRISSDDYRKFHFRLRQLEDLCHEQARKQAQMEETIEREVTARTKKVVEAMEKKIAMYKQAKDLEMEREIQRRFSNSRMSTSTSSSRFSHMSSRSRQSGKESVGSDVATSSPRPFDRIFHPRRSRKRMEMEEQQRKEMKQFRQFIETTERVKAAEKEDQESTPRTKISEAEVQEFEHATREELIAMVTTLRRHVSVQDTQLEDAKRLISDAISAREEAEETAREAVELTLELDSRLERASQEMVVIRDELRRSSVSNVSSLSSLPTSNSYLSRSASVASPSVHDKTPH